MKTISYRPFPLSPLGVRLLTACCVIAGAATLGARSVQAAPEPDLSSMIALPLQGNTLKTRLSIPATKNCSVGDWDAIQKELQHSANRRLLFSIEGLKGSESFKPIAKDIASFDLSKGFLSTFELPKTTKPIALGIFVCKDSDKTGKCAGKPPTKINDIWKIYSQPFPENPTVKLMPPMPKIPKATDKTYAFGFIVVTPKAVYAVKPELRGKEASDAGVEADLAKLGVADAKAVYAAYKKIDEVTISQHPLPVTAENLLELVLPRFDTKQCLPAAAPSPTATQVPTATASPSPSVSGQRMKSKIPPKRPWTIKDATPGVATPPRKVPKVVQVPLNPAPEAEKK